MPVDIQDILRLCTVNSKYLVPVAESEFLEIVGNLETGLEIVNTHIILPPGIEHHDIDEDAEDKVHGYTAQHDDKPLPSRLGAELPGLWRFFKLFLVHALIDHSGYFHITAQGDPTDAIYRIAYFLF